MEFVNSTNHILERKSEREEDAESIDICDRNPNICGMEAGCYSTGSTYQCICPDLLPADSNNSCDRTKELSSPSSSEEINSTNPLKNLAPTEGSFGPHQLLGMLSPSKTVPTNATESNNTHSSDPSNIVHRSSGVYQGTAAVLGVCFLFVIVLGAACFVFIVYRKHKGDFFWWLAAGRRRSAATISLGQCMQLYVVNPNYYSTPSESPLLKLARHLEIPPDNVLLMEEIGEGCFGKVHRGLYTHDDGMIQTVAVKILKDSYHPGVQMEFEREAEIMASFNHENILRLEGVVYKENPSSHWMVFELMQHGDLTDLLRSRSPLVNENSAHVVELKQAELIWIAAQIANGMAYLSSQHFVHRDLATRNCLVGDNLTVKISDFGMSRDIYTSDYYRVGGSRMLPVRWMAPESVTYGKFSLESDVWAYGVVLWEIFTLGKQPYYGHSNDEVVKLILQGILLPSPENCPPFISNIMAGCWKTEPRHRMTFAELYHIILPHTTKKRMTTPSQEGSHLAADSENYILPADVTIS